ncbi:hypothetical protein ACFOEE_19440 [Pseudoalteromonas fenneropenaei]|uniref:Transcriptional regulator n=1 Tax=Pseudoalteromonas fenneropenaei TaxID=1737459 RepID=A0ABV7CPY7_9GAMM
MYQAVLSGDIVHSSKLAAKQYEYLLAKLSEQLAELKVRYQSDHYFFRGDGFQVWVPNARHAWHVALLLRLQMIMLKVDARVAIAVAPQQSHRDNLATSTGPAFTLSGQALDTMKPQRFACVIADTVLDPHFALNILFIDHLLQHLTPRQAEVLLSYFTSDLEGKRNLHETIAQQLGSSRVNITRLLNQANYQLIERFLGLTEALCDAL